jgi:hypothetical protein
MKVWNFLILRSFITLSKKNGNIKYLYTSIAGKSNEKNPAIQNFNMINNLLTLNKEYIKKQEQSLFSMVLHFLLRSYLL